MRLVGTSEWVVIGVLILYVALTPGFPVVRQFLSTGVGKALGLAAIIAVWKYVSQPVALLLLVNYVRCSGMREFMEDGSGATTTTPPPNTYCPSDYKFENGQCMGPTGQSTPAVVCLTGQTWDGDKCVGSATPPPPPSSPPATMPAPPSTSSTTTKQPFTNMTPATYGGVQPDLKETMGNYAPV